MDFKDVIFNLSLDSIIITDCKYKIIECNNETSKIFKKEINDLINLNIRDIISEFDFNNINNYLENNHQLNKYEFSINFNDENVKYYILNATKLFDNDANNYKYIFLIEDVTESKKSKQDLIDTIESLKISREIAENYSNDVLMLIQQVEQSQQELRETNAAKDKFFSIIAHDLKGPLSSIFQLLEVVVKELNTFTLDDLKEYIELIHESVSSTFKLLENLLSWARLQRGTMPFNPDFINLNLIAQNSIDLIKPIAANKNINLKLEIDGDLTFYGDHNMIFTVIRNLISNSIKFTPTNGEITFFAYVLDDDRILAGVQDNGIGMTEADQQKLFKVGVHHTTLGTNNEKGTGLGLILCKELVERNGGKIWVESQLNIGTTFSFTLIRNKF